MAETKQETQGELKKRLRQVQEGETMEQLTTELMPYYPKGTKRATVYKYVQRYLKLDVDVPVDFIVKFCTAKGISPEWLLMGRGSKDLTSPTAAQQFFLKVSELVDAMREKPAESPPVKGLSKKRLGKVTRRPAGGDGR